MKAGLLHRLDDVPFRLFVGLHKFRNSADRGSGIHDEEQARGHGHRPFGMAANVLDTATFTTCLVRFVASLTLAGWFDDLGSHKLR